MITRYRLKALMITAILPISVSVYAVDVTLLNGKILKHAQIIERDASRFKISHTSGSGWYLRSDISANSIEVLDKGSKNLPAAQDALDTSKSDKELKEWTVRLSRYYGLTETGRLLSLASGDCFDISGKVLNVLEDQLIISIDDGSVVALKGLAGYVDDDKVSTLAQYVGTFRYQAVSGSTKTVRQFAALNSPTVDFVKHRGLTNFPEYVAVKRQMAEEARQAQEEARQVQAERAAAKREAEQLEYEESRAKERQFNEQMEAGRKAKREASRNWIMNGGTQR